jgi:hypothetical protein
MGPIGLSFGPKLAPEFYLADRHLIVRLRRLNLQPVRTCLLDSVTRFLKNLFCYLRARILHFDVKGAAYQKISQTLPESDESVDVKESMGDDDRKCAA